MQISSPGHDVQPCTVRAVLASPLKVFQYLTTHSPLQGLALSRQFFRFPKPQSTLDFRNHEPQLTKMRGRITETHCQVLTDYIELAFWLPPLSHLINRLSWKPSRTLLNFGYLQILGHVSNQLGSSDMQSQPYEWLFTEIGSEPEELLVLSSLTSLYISLLLPCPTAAHSLHCSHSMKDHKSICSGYTHPLYSMAGSVQIKCTFPVSHHQA